MLSVIIPAFNEIDSISNTIHSLESELSMCCKEYEIIVVDDGSTDGTTNNIPKHEKLKVVKHNTNLGYGAALKTGIYHSNYDILCITDADGTYPINEIKNMLPLLKSADMVVGSRTGKDVKYSKIRRIPKYFLSFFINYITEKRIPDFNSGLRVIKKEKCLRFLNLYPNGFSFTTTITIAFISRGYQVIFHPISYAKRVGKSKIRPIRDTLNFFKIILKLGLYFYPIKVFMPFVILLLLAFFTSFIYDFVFLNNITDKTVMIFLFSINSFMFTIFAEMINRKIDSI